jgi:hypothetical protein
MGRRDRIVHLDKYLQDLEDRIDEGVEKELFTSWKEFTDNRFQGEVFVPARRKAAPPKIVWPNILINDALGTQGRGRAPGDAQLINGFN